MSDEHVMVWNAAARMCCGLPADECACHEQDEADRDEGEALFHDEDEATANCHGPDDEYESVTLSHYGDEPVTANRFGDYGGFGDDLLLVPPPLVAPPAPARERRPTTNAADDVYGGADLGGGLPLPVMNYGRPD